MDAKSNRQSQLVSMSLEGSRVLRTAYALSMGFHPPPEAADRELIQEILRKEFPVDDLVQHQS